MASLWFWFWLWHALDLSKDGWYAVPYFTTSMASIGCEIILLAAVAISYAERGPP